MMPASASYATMSGVAYGRARLFETPGGVRLKETARLAIPQFDKSMTDDRCTTVQLSTSSTFDLHLPDNFSLV